MSKIVLQWIKIIVFGPSLEFVEMKKSIHSLFIIFFFATKDYTFNLDGNIEKKIKGR